MSHFSMRWSRQNKLKLFAPEYNYSIPGLFFFHEKVYDPENSKMVYIYRDVTLNQGKRAGIRTMGRGRCLFRYKFLWRSIAFIDLREYAVQ